MDTNVLYYGDNLDILRKYIPDESVDLVYLDPPFNSKRDYNVIFRDESGRKSDAQLLAFEDTWHWGPNAEMVYAYLTNTSRHGGSVSDEVSTFIAALLKGLGKNQVTAYVVEMAVRLVELRRVLKPTGSIYLHCDPTSSHYLRLLLDAIFGAANFRNEIVWKRTTAHSDSDRAGRIHDTILFYTKTDNSVWNSVYQPYEADYVEKYYRYKDTNGRQYASGDVAAAGPGPARMFRGELREPPPGSHWRFSQEKIDHLIAEGRIYFTPNGFPRYKRYLDEMPGMPVQDIWSDKAVQPVVSWSKEGLGYPTQKPVALLERIIGASSNPGDIILDPFCGCGTALIASQKLARKWIGIDITYLAIAVMRARLKDTFGLADVPVKGEPTEVEGARQLAQSAEGRYQFQWWALGLVDAKPVGGLQKKGADRGIDGVISFTDKNGELNQVLVSVKSGHVNSAMVRDLKGTIEREKAAIGLFVTLEEATKEMKLEGDTAGLWRSDMWKRDYPRIQILTIADLLSGRKPQLPPFVMPTYQQAPKVVTKADQPDLFDKTQLKVAEPQPHEYVAENDN